MGYPLGSMTETRKTKASEEPVRRNPWTYCRLAPRRIPDQRPVEPIALPTPPPAPAAAPPLTAQTPSPDRSKVSPRRYVLLVEDDPHFAAMVQAYLESRNIPWVCPCSDAAQAVLQAEGLQVGLVLMDIMLPGFGNGVYAYRSLRLNPRLDKRLPVIFMSAMEPAKVREILPVNDPYVRYLPKPFDLALLSKHIETLTGRSLVVDQA